MKTDNFTHEEVFGDFDNEEITGAEAREYLEVSMPAFRRFVASGELKPTSEIGRSPLFLVKDLRAFKRAHQEVNGR